MGRPLKLWYKGLQVIPLSKAVNLNVDKLREILLIEINYNCISKIVGKKRLNTRE